MRKTIFVSGASGIVGYGILKSLRNSSESYRLIGTTIHEFSIAPAFCDVFEKAIPTNHPEYMDWLCNIVEKYSVDMIIPGIEADLYKWTYERQRLQSAGTYPLLNNPDLIELCFDKWNFYQRLVVSNRGISIPTVIEGDFYTFPTPFLFKPTRGYGSKGIVRINNETEFQLHNDKLGAGYIMQPVIGKEEEEYTVSAFFDKESNLIDYFPLRRKLSAEGFTAEAHVVKLDVADVLLSLAKEFKPIGPTNFQFRKHEGGLKLLEINPRISSATSIRACFGYNESVMSVRYFLEGILPTPVEKDSLLNKYAVRYMEDYLFS
jgi:carbamoyl-phosphate synthase large subunit